MTEEPRQPPALGAQARRGFWRTFVRENWYRDVLLIAICLFLWQSTNTSDTTIQRLDDAVDTNNVTVRRLDRAVAAIRAEGFRRRDQTCVLFERTHIDDVAQLQATYNFVAKLSPQEAQTNLNRAIILRLPEVEKKARSTTPPKYCRPASVGVKDPFPVLPSRPPGLLPVSAP